MSDWLIPIAPTKAQAGLMTTYIYFLARVAIGDKQVFQQLVSLTAPTINMSESQVWEGIMNQWWNRVGFFVGFGGQRSNNFSSITCLSHDTAN